MRIYFITSGGANDCVGVRVNFSFFLCLFIPISIFLFRRKKDTWRKIYYSCDNLRKSY